MKAQRQPACVPKSALEAREGESSSALRRGTRLLRQASRLREQAVGLYTGLALLACSGNIVCQELTKLALSKVAVSTRITSKPSLPPLLPLPRAIAKVASLLYKPPSLFVADPRAYYGSVTPKARLHAQHPLPERLSRAQADQPVVCYFVYIYAR